MAYGKKTGGRDIKPGEVRNKWGRNGNPAKQIELGESNISKQIFKEMMQKYLRMTKDELMYAAKNPKTKAVELILIRNIIKAIETGDHKQMDGLINRVIGRVQNEVAVQGSFHSHLVDFINEVED